MPRWNRSRNCVEVEAEGRSKYFTSKKVVRGLIAEGLARVVQDEPLVIATYNTNRPGYDKLTGMRGNRVSGYVYVIWVDGYFKVGASKDIKKRLRTINTHTPHEITVYAIFQVSDMFALEGLLHGRYSKYRVKGEWFKASKKLSSEIAAICNPGELIHKPLREYLNGS